MDGVKAEQRWARMIHLRVDDSQAPGQLGNTLQKERTVPAVPHYRVSADPPCQTPERKDGGRPRPSGGSVSLQGQGGGTWRTDIPNLILPVLALNLP